MKNLLVAQSGGPSAAINATLVGVVEKGLADRNIDKIYGAKNGIMGLIRGNLIELNDKLADPAMLQLLCQTPSSALGS
ncbi:MAG: 6-phosphofructokinase, partial [Anaerotignum sp.]|nr:6-phosphofructokinase [Anaerotignum sp.]